VLGQARPAAMRASILYNLSGGLNMNPRTTSIGQRSKATQSDRRPVTTPGATAWMSRPRSGRRSGIRSTRREKHRAPVKIPIRLDRIRACHLPWSVAENTKRNGKEWAPHRCSPQSASSGGGRVSEVEDRWFVWVTAGAPPESTLQGRPGRRMWSS
jgi:hypothetical protein